MVKNVPMGRLVVTRKKNEAVLIDGGIRIQVIEIMPGKIRLSIQAPEGARIFREEVLEA
jgi:carbon storage regulator